MLLFSLISFPRIDALESKDLRLAIPCMKHLTEIMLPTAGWSSHADRQRLLWAFPRTVTVKWSNLSQEYWSPKKERIGHRLDRDRLDLSLSQLSQSDRSDQREHHEQPDGSHGSLDTLVATRPREVVQFSQMIVGWHRLKKKEKALLHGHLAKAMPANDLVAGNDMCVSWQNDTDWEIVGKQVGKGLAPLALAYKSNSTDELLNLLWTESERLRPQKYMVLAQTIAYGKFWFCSSCRFGLHMAGGTNTDPRTGSAGPTWSWGLLREAAIAGRIEPRKGHSAALWIPSTLDRVATVWQLWQGMDGEQNFCGNYRVKT